MLGMLPSFKSLAHELPASSNLLGAWFADDYVSSPNSYVPNRVYKTSGPSSNSSVLPQDHALLPRPIGSNVTLTIGGQSDPYGGYTANRAVASSNANAYVNSTSYFKAGTYTISMKVISNIASPPTMSWSIPGATGGGGTFTPTQSWATYTITFTIPTSGSYGIAFLANNGTSNNFDVNFTEFAIYSGSSAGPFVDGSLYGHMYFRGPTGISAVPTISGNVIDFTSPAAADAFIAFPAAQTLSAGTIMALVQIVGNPGYTSIFSDYSTSSGRTLGEAYSQTPIGFNQSGNSMGLVTNKGFNFVVHGTRFDNASNDRMTGIATVGKQSAGIAQFSGFQNCCVANLGNNGARGNIKLYALAFWNVKLTNTQYSQAYKYMVNKAKAAGLTVTTLNRYLVAEGDSITAGYNSTGYGYPNLAATNNSYSPFALGQNIAVSGSRISDMVNRAAGLDATLGIQDPSGSQKSILSVLIGANDLLSLGTSTWLTNLQSYLSARYAAGWNKIVLGTITPQNNSSFNTARDTVNPTLRTWVGTYCDAIADFANDPTMGPDSAASNTTYYNTDGIHPTTAGQNILYPIYASAVNSL